MYIYMISYVFSKNGHICWHMFTSSAAVFKERTLRAIWFVKAEEGNNLIKQLEKTDESDKRVRRKKVKRQQKSEK